MTSKEIFDLFSRFENSSIQSMKLSCGDFSMELSKAAVPAEYAPAAPKAVPAAASPAPSLSTSGDAAINAPLVGTFYAASAPGAAPFAAVGSKVRKGETVCLIEAMKMMSEIPAPCDCIITEILKEDGQLVSFDEPLFRYQPC